MFADSFKCGQTFFDWRSHLILVTFLSIALFFLLNLIVFTIFFSEMLMESGWWDWRGFVISFGGVSVGTVFAFFLPWLPTLLSVSDVGTGLVWFTWAALTTLFYKTRWLHNVVFTAVAVILYLVILVIAMNFFVAFQVTLPVGGSVFPAKPAANFTYSPTRPLVGQAMVFKGTGYDRDGSISAYVWDFGDGETGRGMAVKHVYESAGTYKVVLTVTDNDGFQGHHTTDVTIFSPD